MKDLKNEERLLYILDKFKEDPFCLSIEELKIISNYIDLLEKCLIKYYSDYIKLDKKFVESCKNYQEVLDDVYSENFELKKFIEKNIKKDEVK